MEKTHVPQHIDEPARIILWTVDELILFLVPFFILFFCFDQIMLGIATGTGLVFTLRRIKGEQGHYFLYSVIYWHLPSMIQFKSIPPSCYREFLG
jgi:type IV conjugative transfer system protein TraL